MHKNIKNKKIEISINENPYIKYMLLFPIILMIALVPIILRMKVNALAPEIAVFWTGNIQTDLFCYTKTKLIIIISVMMLFNAFFFFDKKLIKDKLFLKKILILTGIFGIISILSVFTSDYKSVAVWGAPERYEGVVIHLCYMIMFVYTYFVILAQKDITFIRNSIFVLVIILSILGISQILNKDLLNTELARAFIVPNEYKDNLTATSTAGLVYMTLMNPNYVGSYASIVIPFLTIMAISREEKIGIRILSAVLATLTLFILVKSNSQAGLVGVGVGLLAVIVISFNDIFANKKILVVLSIFLICVIFGANILSKGLLFENTADIFNDAKSLFVKDYEHDPTYGLPIYDVKTEGNKAEIFTAYGKLEMTVKTALNIEFKDDKGNVVNYNYNEVERSYTLGSPFEKIMILLGDVSNSEYMQIAVHSEGKTYYLLEWVKGDGIYLVDASLNRYETIVAPHIGFEGSEKVGSMRGYIWSRTLPLVLEKPILGYGPDNFITAFPIYDVAAKTYAYDTPFMIVDKPHNIYLLYAINSGLGALVVMLILWGMYIVTSFKKYAFKREYSKSDYYAIACTTAIVGYLAAGFFNDSVPVIAPVFWVILGTGYALNEINKNKEV